MTIHWASVVGTITKNFPKKALGQNFLINYSIIETILKKIDLMDNVLEIGPGSGILSYGIINHLQRGSCLTLVEKDSDFIGHLKELLEPLAASKGVHLTIINGDGLWYLPEKPVQVIANIPYNISSQLFYHWLQKPLLFPQLVIMVQKEFGEKLWQNYKINNNYSTLTVLAQGLGSVSKIMDLAPTSFKPAPSVHSQVIYYKNIHHGPTMEQLVPLINQAFSHPRKQLKNNIKDKKFIAVMENNGWSSLRPDGLSPQNYWNWALLAS
jgi:16S rRNA (adenine1518-N6/adenine1519-N6)-dimethyltransferase